MYYNYHGINIRKIKNGELVKYEYVDQYKKIGRVLLLYFKDGTVKFIREYAWFRYDELLMEFDSKHNRE